MAPEKKSPWKMVLGKTVPEKKGPRKNGPREKWSPENWSRENLSPEKWSPENSGTKNRWVGFEHRSVCVCVCVECWDVINLWKPKTREHFSGDQFSRDQFSGNHFSRGPFFQGPFFSRTIFPGTIFPGDHFSGDHFSEDHFSAYLILFVYQWMYHFLFLRKNRITSRKSVWVLRHLINTWKKIHESFRSSRTAGGIRRLNFFKLNFFFLF